MYQHKPGSLLELIQALEQGNQYHISIEFFHQELKESLQLPRKHLIHETPFCEAMKQKKDGLYRCLQCKSRAMDKLRREHKPFSGYCTFGTFEVCYPVYDRDTLLGIIFVGNLLRDEQTLCARSGLEADHPLLQTMQRDMEESDCLKIARIVASYLLMLRTTMPQTQSKSIHSTIVAVKEYVDSYFFRNVTLTELARLYHYNEKYLGTLFKQQVGKSFHEYLNLRRLNHAKKLLSESEDTILDVAVKSGFNNVTYFNRLFKAQFHMTPSQYRVGVNETSAER